MSPQQAAEAQKFYDSVYGTNSAHRNQVLNDLKTNPGKLQAAKADYEAIANDPKVSPAEKQAKLKAWQDAYDKYNADYQAYRNLPEEADAWAAGDAAEQAFKNAPKPDPKLGTDTTQPLPTSGDKTQPLPGKGGTDPTNPAAHPEHDPTAPEAPPMAEDPTKDPSMTPPGDDQGLSGNDKTSEQLPNTGKTPKERADALARQRGDLSERAQAARRGDLRAEVDALRDDIETLQELSKEGEEGLEDDLAEREQQLSELSQKIAEAEGKIPSKESPKNEAPTLDPKTDPARKFIEGQGGKLKTVELPAGCGVSVDRLLDTPPAQLRKLLATQPDDALRSALGLENDIDISKTRDAIRTVVKVVEQQQRLMQKL
jgi:hypothetical protein